MSRDEFKPKRLDPNSVNTANSTATDPANSGREFIGSDGLLFSDVNNMVSGILQLNNEADMLRIDADKLRVEVDALEEYRQKLRIDVTKLDDYRQLLRTDVTAIEDYKAKLRLETDRLERDKSNVGHTHTPEQVGATAARRGTSATRNNNNTAVNRITFGLVGTTLHIWADE